MTRSTKRPRRSTKPAGGYAPTIGILGAVLGLIHVMENLSDPNKLGAGIAVAFVATVYGVGSANLLFLPIASKLRSKAGPPGQAPRADPRGHPGHPGGAEPAPDRPEAAGTARDRLERQARRGPRSAPREPAGRAPIRRRSAGAAATAREPRALARLVRGLHHAAVRVLHDDVRDLDRGRAQAVGGGRFDAGGVRERRRAVAIAEGRWPGRRWHPARRRARKSSSRPSRKSCGPGSSRSTLSDLQARLGEQLSEQIRDGTVEVLRDPRGLVVSLREAGRVSDGQRGPVPHRPGRARCRRGVAGRGREQRPGRGAHRRRPDPHRSVSLELGTVDARATNVVAFLAGAGMPPDRLSAAGYGEFHPRAPNDSDLNRAKNRRVDIVILNVQTSAREEPGQSAGM